MSDRITLFVKLRQGANGHKAKERNMMQSLPVQSVRSTAGYSAIKNRFRDYTSRRFIDSAASWTNFSVLRLLLPYSPEFRPVRRSNAWVQLVPLTVRVIAQMQ